MTGIDEYTKLMLHLNGDEGQVTIVDSSLSPKSVGFDGYAGVAHITTGTYKFGGSSCKVAGASYGPYALASSDFYLGTSNFTIDCWVRYSSLPSSGYDYIVRQPGDGSNSWIFWLTTTQFILYVKTGPSTFTYFTITHGTTISTGVWYHLALVRNGNNLLGFIDGDYKGQTSITWSIPNVGNTYIAHSYFNGYIDEFRLSVGVARWTADFTPPTAEYDEAEKTAAESLSVDDSAIVVYSPAYKATDESLSADDSVAAVKEVSKAQAESLSLDDTIQVEDWEKGLPHRVGIDEQTTVIQTVWHDTEDESVGIGASLQLMWLTDTLPEDLGLQDTIIVGQELDDTYSEAFGVLDDVIATREYEDQAVDSLGVHDAAAVGIEYVAPAIESISFGESVIGEAYTVGRIDETFPALRGELFGNRGIHADLPALAVSSFVATAGKVGTLRQGILPAMTMTASGMVSQIVSLVGRLSALSSTVLGTQRVAESMAVRLPALTALVTGKVGPVCTLDGTLPILEKGAITGYINPRGVISANLPALAADIFVNSLVFEILCMNTANLGLTTYTNFPFNSMCRFKGKHLGCSASGIYEISSAYGDDDGTVIRPQVRTGFIDLEKNIMKRIDHAWLGFQANGALSVSIVTDDGNTYTYTVDQLTTNDTGQRVKFGKGIKDRYVAIDIQAACSVFELDKIRIFARPTAKGR